MFPLLSKFLNRSKSAKSSYKRNSNKLWPLLLLLLIGTSGGLMLWVVFGPVEGEQDDISLLAFNSSGYEYSTSKGDFQAIVDEAAEIEASAGDMGRPPLDFSGVVPPNLNNSTIYSSWVKSMNLKVFQISARYMNKDVIKNIPAEYADPLIPLSSSVVEWSGYGNPNVLWTPAIPLRYLENLSNSDPKTYVSPTITPELLETFGVKDLATNDEFWRAANTNPRYQGPQQLSTTHGAQIAAIKSDLKGSDVARYGGIVQRLPRQGAAMNAVARAGFPSGDRYNWADSVNRTVGSWDYQYGLYLKTSGIDRTKIHNVYAFIGMLGTFHVYPSLAVTPDNRSLSDTTGSETRNWVHALGSPEVLAILKKDADAIVSVYAQTGRLSMPNEKSLARDAVVEARRSGLVTMSEDSYKKQIIFYPVFLIRNYLVMQSLYQGDAE